jgi:hypothetical protein
MANREKAGRDGLGNAIDGRLSYNSQSVHHYDEVTTNEVPDETLYVLLTQQTASNISDFRRFRWQCLQTVEIVSKQINSVSKDIVDHISEQIEQIIIYPDNQPGNGGMIAQDGWEFSDVQLESVNYTEFQLENNFYEITKILNFSYIITRLS